MLDALIKKIEAAGFTIVGIYGSHKDIETPPYNTLFAINFIIATPEKTYEHENIRKIAKLNEELRASNAIIMTKTFFLQQHDGTKFSNPEKKWQEKFAKKESTLSDKLELSY